MKSIDVADFAQKWIADWNSHDLERILAHYSGDVELVSPLVAGLTGQSDGAVRGLAALRQYFTRGLEMYPTLRFDFIRLYSGVRSCVLEYHSINGLCTAELMEFDELGKVRRVVAITLTTRDHPQVRRALLHLDVDSVARSWCKLSRHPP
jgi:hypothetical protein